MTTHYLSFKEKVGYAMGDAGANLVWRGALAYLAVFYTDTFGISAAAASILFLVVRLSDGVTDIIMGMIADRTDSKMGRFRPWILWSTPFLALFMVLCFTTPNLSPTGKLIYAYVTYIGLTLAYTVSNVPYSALMGVMTPCDMERTKLSSYRFVGAFTGGLLVMGFLPRLVSYFGNGDDAIGYQQTMYIFAGMLSLLMLTTFFTTKERINVKVQESNTFKKEITELLSCLPFIVVPLLSISVFFYYRDLYSGVFFIAIMSIVYILAKKLVSKDRETLSSSQRDLVDLLTNRPWLILLGIGFLTMMFNGIKYGVIVYYFKYVVGDELLAGQYFIALLVVSILGAMSTSYLAKLMGKNNLLIVSLLAGALFTALFYWLPGDDLIMIFTLGCLAEFFAAMMPTLFFTMLGDAADYSEWRNKRRATGLIYTAGTFVQKTGGGFAGALVLLVLANYGYDGMNEQTISQSLPGMKLLMSWIPAGFAVSAA